MNIKVIVMLVIGIVIMDIGFFGNPGSLLGSIITPDYMIASSF